MKNLQYIDALRGIAIIGVIIVHCQLYGSNNYPDIVKYIIGNGARGVQLFYVASAFTLFLSLNNRKSNLEQQNEILPFFIRRFFRIAPMYYIGIIYYIIQDGLGSRYWLGDAPEISIWNIISNICFTHGFYPYWITSLVPGGWSIANEMLFYCMLPTLFLRIKNLNHSIIFFISTIGLKTLLHILLVKIPLISDNRLWSEFLFLYLPSQLPVFACGIIMYFLITTPKSDWHIEPKIVFITSALFLVQYLIGIKVFFPNHILFSIAFIGLGYALSEKCFVVLVNPLTRYIGKISYSMYLSHFAILYWMNRMNFIDFIPISNIQYPISNIQYPISNILNYTLRFLFTLFITISLATIFYHFIEVPFQNMGRMIIKKLKSIEL